jgi:amidohydrolase
MLRLRLAFLVVISACTSSKVTTGVAPSGAGSGASISTPASLEIRLPLPPARDGVVIGTFDGQVASTVARVEPQIIELRHRIHQNPELGNRELKTAELVAAHLRELGLEVRTGIAHTGVVGILRGGKPGPVVAVRADMDALPVTEENDLSFRSKVRTTYAGQDTGVMHACGHDIHTSVQLGVVSVLAGLRAKLPGTVMFVFQPAEEGAPPGESGGAELMLEEGVFAELKPQAIFALHVLSSLELGKVSFTYGTAFAASDNFRAVIKGKQSHASRPNESIDAVLTAAQVVTALQTIRARNLDPRDAATVSVSTIHGGLRTNILPPEVEISGTVRVHDPALQPFIERRMHEVLDGTTRAAGASYTLDYRRGYPAVINHTGLVDATLPSLVRVAGKDRVAEDRPTMGAEDFAFFAREVPGFYFRIGSTRPGTTSGGHHTPQFIADDAAVPFGMRVMSTVVLDFLERHAPIADH